MEGGMEGAARPPPQVAAFRRRPCPPPPGLPWQAAAARMYPTVADRHRAAPPPAQPRAAECRGGLSSSGPLRLFFIFFKCWWQMGPCALLSAVPHRPLRGVGWGGLGSEAGMSERDFLLMPLLQPV